MVYFGILTKTDFYIEDHVQKKENKRLAKSKLKMKDENKHCVRLSL